MIYICSTIIILAIIILLGFYLYLTKYNPIKDKIYKDRLIMLKDKYKEIKDNYDEEDNDIPISVHQLISLVDIITDRIY